VVSNICYFHPYLGKIPTLTNIFQLGWNHQLAIIIPLYTINKTYRSHPDMIGSPRSRCRKWFGRIAMHHRRRVCMTYWGHLWSLEGEIGSFEEMSLCLKVMCLYILFITHLLSIYYHIQYTCITRWRFQVLFMFTPFLGKMNPFWWAYLTNGLVQLPTRLQLVSFSWCGVGVVLVFVFCWFGSPS